MDRRRGRIKRLYHRPSAATGDLKALQLQQYLLARHVTSPANHRLRNLRNVRTFRSQRSSGSIICADALTFLQSLEPDSAHVVFLDPPFNLGKNYSAKLPNIDWVTDGVVGELRRLRGAFLLPR